MCIACFSDWSFAATEGVGHLWSIAWTLDFMISVLSWIWVVFANLAWKFLTNNWVYGQVLWLDALLWQYRNIVKNMANFCLWFYLVYVIFKWLIWQYKGKENIVKNLWNVLKRVLVAWIWVQASWFLTSVVVDISTITLSAAGALPFQVLSMDDNLEKSINNSMWEFFDDGGNIAYGKIHNLFPKGSAENSFIEIKDRPTEGTITKDNMMDFLLPNKDDISGPLYYMWFAILRTQELNSVKAYGVEETEKKAEAWAKQTILNLIIQWWTTIVYSIEMGVFCVIALMRILYLWMFIVLSPLAILLACIQKAWGDDLLKKKLFTDLMKQINLKTFLAKVFQPAIIVLWISLSMIFVTLISGIVNNDPTRSTDNVDIWWARASSLKEWWDSTNDDKTYTTTIEWNLVKFSMSGAWKWILDFIMSIITVVLVYFIINISIKAWDAIFGADWQDFLSERIKKVTDWVTGIMKSVPIVPVPWYDKDWVSKTQYMSVNKVSHLWEEGIGILSGKIRDRYDEQNAVINAWFNKNGWVKVMPFKSDDQREVVNVVEWNGNIRWLEILTKQFEKIRKLGDRSKDDGWLNNGEWYWMILDPSATYKWWQWRFKERLTTVDLNDITWADQTVWKRMVNSWRGLQGTDQTLEKLFKGDPMYVRAYAKQFNLWNIDKWDDLKSMDISEKKS